MGSRTAWFSCVLALGMLGCGASSGASSDIPSGAASGVGAAGSNAGQNGVGGVEAAGGSSGEAGASGGGVAGAPSDACSAMDLEGLMVFSGGSWDPLGYPPYALEGCSLVYVAPDVDGGALHFRNLTSGDDVELEPSASKPRRPALAGSVITWEVGDFAASQVRVHYAGKTKTVSGSFDHAGEPRAARDAVVFTAFLGPNPNDDTDVYLYRVDSEDVTPIAVGPGQQRFADVSAGEVAVTDFSEDERGYFDELQSIADVVIVDRSSLLATTRKRPGKQAFPLLGDGGALAYLDWGAVHPEPKFSQFGLRLGYLSQPLEADVDVTPEPIHTNPAYVRPSLHGSHLDYVDTQAGIIGLYRYSLETDQAPVLSSVAGSRQLFGPVATEAMTLVATPFQDQVLTLTAVAR
jgi:hypothetical protein